MMTSHAKMIVDRVLFPLFQNICSYRGSFFHLICSLVKEKYYLDTFLRVNQLKWCITGEFTYIIENDFSIMYVTIMYVNFLLICT